MTISAALLLLVVQVLAALLLVATVVAGARKGATNRRLRREAARSAAVRPVVVALVSGEPAAWPDGALGRHAERLAVEALRRVRGEARSSVVDALEARGVVDRALRRTRSWRPLRRARAAEVLGVIGAERALPDLVRLLRDRSPVVRRVAARAVGSLGLPAGATPLLASVEGKRSLPAGVVAMALERIGPSTSTALRAALHERSATSRFIAAQLLGHHEVLAAAGDLAAALEVEPLPAVRAELARALGAIGSPVAVPRLVEVLGGVDPPAVRAAAAEALGRIGAADATPLLAGALAEGGYDVPHAAARALHELGAGGRSVLVDVLRDEGAGADHAAEVLAVGVVRRDARR